MDHMLRLWLKEMRLSKARSGSFDGNSITSCLSLTSEAEKALYS